MPKYRTNWHLALDGKFFEPGEEVELTETKAATIGACVTLVETPAPAEETKVEEASEADGDDAGDAKPVRKGKGKGGAE